MIALIDYGMGNLNSVAKAGRALGAQITVTDSARAITRARKLVLPGVGHFGKAVRELKKRKIFTLIKDRANEGVPFLGICVGMQLIFEKSQEAPGVCGLGLIKGTVEKFSGKDLIVPHMGWNQVRLQTNPSTTLRVGAERSRSAKDQRPKTKDLFRGVKDNSFFYFAHSYYCKPSKREVILTTTRYGREFVSSINKGNIWAVQFHPEKSQALGLQTFKNFLFLC